MIEFNLCRSGRYGEGLSLGKFGWGATGKEHRSQGEVNISCTRVPGNRWAFKCFPWYFHERLEVP